MMNISVIAVGKIKDKYLIQGIAEYTKRLTRYIKLSITEIQDEAIPEGASQKQEEEVVIKEGKKILSSIKEDSFVITLCIEGDKYDSIELADKISRLAVQGKSNIAFVIGGSLGLWDQVKKRADMRLSFSKMTFPHQLMRLLLLEQVYRAFKINSNEVYHK